MSTKFDSTYSAVVTMAEQLVGEGKYDSTYSAVLAIYQNLTSDVDTKFDSVYSIVVKIADGIESGEIDLGGGSGEESDDIRYDIPKVRFYNYKGEIIEEWDFDDRLNKTELPSFTADEYLDTEDGNPVYLRQEGWNWSLEKIKESINPMNVGALYKPTNNKTYVKVRISKEQLTCKLDISGPVTSIDWGDGTTQTSFPNYQKLHTYNGVGDYLIKIEGDLVATYIYNNNVFVDDKPASLCADQVISWFYGNIDTYSNIDHCFNGCTNLKYITFPMDPTNKSGKLDLGYCQELQYVTYPLSVNYLYSKTLLGCRRLKTLSFSENITSMGSIGDITDNYNQCDLEYLPIPSNQRIIDNNWFNWGSFKYITVPPSIINVTPQYAFANRLLKVINYNGLTLNASSPFYECQSLEEIEVNSLNNTSNAFYNCSSLKSINLYKEDYITSIGENCFYNCFNLTEVVFPPFLERIEYYAFVNCYNLRYIEIPSTITYIGDAAFDSGIYSQKTVDFSNCTQVPELSSTNAFNSRALILVPESLYDEWISTTNWSSLSSQIIAV